MHEFQRNWSNSKISLELIEYFVYMVPVCGPGSWVIAKFSYFTQIEDFIKNSIHGEYIDKIQKASHGHIFTFCVNRISTSKRNILVKVRVVLTLLVMGGGVLKTHSSRRSRLRIFFNSNDSANLLDFSYFAITQL